MYRLTKEITTDVLYAVISCHIHRSNLHIKWEKRMEYATGYATVNYTVLKIDNLMECLRKI